MAMARKMDAIRPGDLIRWALPLIHDLAMYDVVLRVQEISLEPDGTKRILMARSTPRPRGARAGRDGGFARPRAL